LERNKSKISAPLLSENSPKERRRKSDSSAPLLETINKNERTYTVGVSFKEFKEKKERRKIREYFTKEITSFGK